MNEPQVPPFAPPDNQTVPPKSETPLVQTETASVPKDQHSGLPVVIVGFFILIFAAASFFVLNYSSRLDQANEDITVKTHDNSKTKLGHF